VTERAVPGHWLRIMDSDVVNSEGAQGLGATRTEQKRDGLFHSSPSVSSAMKIIIQTRAGQYNDL